MFRLEQSAKRTKNEPDGKGIGLEVGSGVGQLKAPLETPPPAKPQEKTQKAATLTPPKVFRLETIPILCFLKLTELSNCTHVPARKTGEANEKRTAMTFKSNISKVVKIEQIEQVQDSRLAKAMRVAKGAMEPRSSRGWNLCTCELSIIDVTDMAGGEHKTGKLKRPSPRPARRREHE